MATFASLIPSESWFCVIFASLVFIVSLIASIPDKPHDHSDGDKHGH